MVCFPKRNFLTAMIPLHRRDVHMKKYVAPSDAAASCINRMHLDCYRMATRSA